MTLGVDPTRIDINFDPLQQMMTGVAFHGNTPFSVPYMTQVADNLWQGGCRNGLVLPYEIKHVVSLYKWEEYEVNHNLDSILTVTMFDSLDQAFEQIDAIADWVNAARKTAPVLVHCQAGLNRSSLIVARALIKDGMSPDDAINLIRSQRSEACLCNSSFEDWLRS